MRDEALHQYECLSNRRIFLTINEDQSEVICRRIAANVAEIGVARDQCRFSRARVPGNDVTGRVAQTDVAHINRLMSVRGKQLCHVPWEAGIDQKLQSGS